MKRLLTLLILGFISGAGTYWWYVGANAPIAEDDFDAQLAWMRSELRLTDKQYAQIEQLHRSSRPQLLSMSERVRLMQREFQDFERQRKTSDQVDFLEFARFVEHRRELDRACIDSTRRLVAASAEVMTPTQRQRYFDLLNSTEPLVGILRP